MPHFVYEKCKRLHSITDRPLVSCHDASAALGDKNVVLKCDVTSRPSVVSFHWTLNSNLTTLSSKQSTPGFHSFKKVGIFFGEFFIFSVFFSIAVLSLVF